MEKRKDGRAKRLLWPVAAALALGAKLLLKVKFLLIPILKFGGILLKTGGTMFLSLAFYAMSFGLAFAIGFVLLLFVHECGHLVMARRLGLRAGWPVFIPFMGAFIALKDAPRNAWIEALVGIGGPLAGSAGAALCELTYLATGEPFFAALAYTGFLLNLFNLAPVGFLDGGRIATAISPWLWVVGVAVLGVLLIVHFNLIVLLVLVSALPRLRSLFRARTDEERRYFELPRRLRVVMAVAYFGLLALLAVGMKIAHLQSGAA